jgi:hypothetical protein
VIANKGFGAGGWLATLQFSNPDRPKLRDWSHHNWIRCDGAEELLSAHALQGDPQFGQKPTAEAFCERKSRGDRAVTVEFALLVEGFDLGPEPADCGHSRREAARQGRL